MATLFDPIRVGDIDAANRIVMAPLTRNRAGAGRTPTPLMATYYEQRATAGLIVSEASQISPEGQGYLDTPGIYSAAGTGAQDGDRLPFVPEISWNAASQYDFPVPGNLKGFVRAEVTRVGDRWNQLEGVSSRSVGCSAVTRVTKETTVGKRYLDLQREARRTGRPTDELIQLYALGCFLDRLVHSNFANNFVLKGGVLLAALDARRRTRDIDLPASARQRCRCDIGSSTRASAWAYAALMQRCKRCKMQRYERR